MPVTEQKRLYTKKIKTVNRSSVIFIFMFYYLIYGFYISKAITLISETKRLYLREMGVNDCQSLCEILFDRETMYAYEHES